MGIMDYNKLLDQIKRTNWGVKIERLKDLPCGDIYMLPSGNVQFGNWGNKVVHFGNWISISTIDKNEFTNQFEIAKELSSEKSLFQDNELINNFQFEETDFSVSEMMLLIEVFFSSNFININEVSNKLHKLKESTEELDNMVETNYIRFEELFETYRVIFSYSPKNGAIEIVLERNKSKLSNPVSDFFEWKFEYDQYHNAIKKHNLIFLELQGEPKYPLASYNDQNFEIVFNVFDVEGSVMDIYKKSSWNQVRFVKKIIKFLNLFFGTDVNGKDIRDLAKERGKSSYGIIQNKFNCFEGKRSYQMGLYSVDAVYGVYQAEDDEENLYEVAGLKVNIKPYKSNKVVEKGWYHHPMVYEWGK
jgi:hypothetical protein